MDRLASELAIGRDLQGRLAGMPAGHRRDVLEDYLGETRGHAERVRTRLLELGGSDERAGLGTRLAAVVAGRTRRWRTRRPSGSPVQEATPAASTRRWTTVQRSPARSPRTSRWRGSRIWPTTTSPPAWPLSTSPTRNACSSGY